MSIIEPGWLRRAAQRRRERRWKADTRATVKWAVATLSITQAAA